MIIRPAKAGDLREIMDFYAMMCAELGKQDFLPEGNKGGFPPIDMVVSAIDDSELFVGEEGGQIMAAYILNNDADPAYSTVSWQITVPSEQASVLHALRVHPGFGGKGYASQLVEHAIHVAKEKNQRAVRLDCMRGIPFHTECISITDSNTLTPWKYAMKISGFQENFCCSRECFKHQIEKPHIV